MEQSPIFDIHPNFNKIKGSLGWGNVKERTAIIGVSRQLHQLLHDFAPDLIDDRPGPYRQKVVEEAFSRYIASKRLILINPGQPGICQARAIPKLRLILGHDSLPFSHLANSIKKHLVLLDIID
jgi:hypothetical protein